MGDRIDKAVMLLVAPNFADQKNRIQNESATMAPKKIIPRKTLTPSRQLRMIHPLPTANATAAADGLLSA
jgi:hypothetical protein